MALNPITCGNCGTENPPEQDVCINCGQPLTQSAEAGLREQIEAQDDPSLFGSPRGSEVEILPGNPTPIVPGRGDDAAALPPRD